MQLSFASISFLFPWWGEVAGGGPTRSWWCFCTTRGCWSLHLLHCCAGRNWERSGGSIYSHWQGKIHLRDHCWLLLGCPKISITKLSIQFPSKCECFTSAAWSSSSSAGLCSWPVSEFLGEEPPAGVSQNCCQTARRFVSFLRWQLPKLKISRCV